MGLFSALIGYLYGPCQHANNTTFRYPDGSGATVCNRCGHVVSAWKAAPEIPPPNPYRFTPRGKKEMKVYLGGPIQGCDDSECKAWRDQAKLVLKMPCHDPLAEHSDYRGVEPSDDMPRIIVEEDKAAIDGCTHLLVWHPRPSTGTDMEVIYGWENDKTVVAVVPTGSPVSPWLIYHAAYIFGTLDEAIKHLNDVYAVIEGSLPRN